MDKDQDVDMNEIYRTPSKPKRPRPPGSPDGGGIQKRLCDDTRQVRRNAEISQELPTPPPPTLPTPPPTQKASGSRRIRNSLRSSKGSVPASPALGSSVTEQPDFPKSDFILDTPTLPRNPFRGRSKQKASTPKLNTVEETGEVSMEEDEDRSIPGRAASPSPPSAVSAVEQALSRGEAQGDSAMDMDEDGEPSGHVPDREHRSGGPGAYSRDMVSLRPPALATAGAVRATLAIARKDAVPPSAFPIPRVVAPARVRRGLEDIAPPPAKGVPEELSLSPAMRSNALPSVSQITGVSDRDAEASPSALGSGHCGSRILSTSSRQAGGHSPSVLTSVRHPVPGSSEVVTRTLLSRSSSMHSASIHEGSDVISASSSEADVLSHASSMHANSPPPNDDPQIISTSSSQADVLSLAPSMHANSPPPDDPQVLSCASSMRSASASGDPQIISASGSQVDVLSHTSSMRMDTPPPNDGSDVISASSSQADVLSHASSMHAHSPPPKDSQVLSRASSMQSASIHEGSDVISASSSQADVLSHTSSMHVHSPPPNDPQVLSRAPSMRSASASGDPQIVSASGSQVNILSHTSSMHVNSPPPNDPQVLSRASSMRSASASGDPQIVSASGSQVDVLSHTSSMHVNSPPPNDPQVLSRASSMRSASASGDPQIVSASGSQVDVLSHASSMRMDTPPPKSLLGAEDPQMESNPAFHDTHMMSSSGRTSRASSIGILSTTSNLLNISRTSSMGVDSPLQYRPQIISNADSMRSTSIRSISPISVCSVTRSIKSELSPLSMISQDCVRRNSEVVTDRAPGVGSTSARVQSFALEASLASSSVTSGRSKRSEAQSEIRRNAWRNADLLFRYHSSRNSLANSGSQRESGSSMVLSGTRSPSLVSSEEVEVLSDCGLDSLDGGPASVVSNGNSIVVTNSAMTPAHSIAMSTPFLNLSDQEDSSEAMPIDILSSRSSVASSSPIISTLSRVGGSGLLASRNDVSVSGILSLYDPASFDGAVLRGSGRSGVMGSLTDCYGESDEDMEVESTRTATPATDESDTDTLLRDQVISRSVSALSFISNGSEASDEDDEDMEVESARTPTPSNDESDTDTLLRDQVISRSVSALSFISNGSEASDEDDEDMEVESARTPTPSNDESDTDTLLRDQVISRSVSALSFISNGSEASDEDDEDMEVESARTPTPSNDESDTDTLLRDQVISRSVSALSFMSVDRPSDIRDRSLTPRTPSPAPPVRRKGATGSQSKSRRSATKGRARVVREGYRRHLSPPPGVRPDFDDNDDDPARHQAYDSDATIDIDKETDEDADDDENQIVLLSPSSDCLILSGQSSVNANEGAPSESGSHSGREGSAYRSDISVGKFARRPAMAKVYRRFKRQPEATLRHGDMAEFVVALCADGEEPRRSARISAASSTGSSQSSSISATSSRISRGGRRRKATSRPKPNKPRNVRRGRDPLRVQIASAVRKHAYDMMGRTPAVAGPDPITSVSLAHVNRFANTGRREHGPNEDHLELFLDFRSILPTSRAFCNKWNDQAAVVFTANFLREFPEHQPNRALVLSCFKAHRRQLENQFNRFSAFDDEETRDKAITDRKIQLRRERCSRRIKTLESFRGKGPMVDHLAKLARNKFDWKVCSGDDTDSEGEKVITTLNWRSKKLRSTFRTVDLLGLVLRFPDGAHATSGQFPQYRYDPTQDLDPPGERVMETRRHDFKKGLPENFYDPAWLRTLEEEEREALEMTPPVELKFPQALVRLAETAVTIKDRRSKPLPRQWDV